LKKFLQTRIVQLAFGSAIAVLLVVGALAYRSVVVSNENVRWVQHSHEVLENLQDLRLAMENIAESVRGFVLTGRESYLENYRANILGVQQRATAVRNLTLDNPEQQRNILILERLAAERVERAEMNISLRRAQGLDSAADAIRNGSGQQATATFQEIVSRMQDEERRLLIYRNVVADRSVTETKVILVLGIVVGLLITVAAGWNVQHDNARRGTAERALRDSEDKYRGLAQGVQDYAILMLGPRGEVRSWNRGAEKMSGYTFEDVYGHHFSCFFPAEDIKLGKPEEILQMAATNGLHEVQSMRVRKDGSSHTVRTSFTALRDSAGELQGFSVVGRDLSESVRKETAAREMALQMAHSAQHDCLTDLPNRMLLNERISHAIALAQRHEKRVAVMFLDLDGFKHVNSSLGHPIGDKLLQSIAARLVDCVRSSDTVSRQGGDEFVVLLSDVERAEDVALTARRMLAAVAEAHRIDLSDLHITASIGVSVYPDDGLDAETLIKNADTAMYQSKENGRQNYQFFAPAMNVRAVERQSIEESLRRALEQQEFTLHYQPKIDLKTGAIIGAEALIRWTDPSRGPVSPAQFIPVAEDSGLILPIGNWVLREACQQARAWTDAGLPAATMAVNVSAIEFRSETFLQGVFAALSDTGMDPRCLELELTESVLMARAESTASILQALREKGIKVAVDDFGTGYSSLSYLRKFPVDALKIDQSFVRQISKSNDDATIVTAVIAMARSLKLRVIAEGVETLKELEFLRARHCDEAQGYYFSRPVSAAQYAMLLRTGIPKAPFSAQRRASKVVAVASGDPLQRWSA
jgi:diguanylate cyclase (GGDEF)-like protein/PAS domain S-box-containing protein